MIRKTTGAVGFDEIDKALVAVEINVAASLGVLTIIFIRALPIVPKGNGLLYFLLS